jgi:hypothetical protein
MSEQSATDKFGIDELLQLTGIDREAKALAFLYAAFRRTEVSANPVQDALDCLIPFIVPYLNSISGKQILVDGIKTYLSATYGFDIPLYAIDQLLPALTRRNYIEYRKAVGRYFAKRQEPQFETTKQEIETQFDTVVEELGRYATGNGFDLTPPSGSWSEALLNFLRSRRERNERQIANIKGVLANTVNVEAAIVGSFIKHLYDTQQLLFNQLLNVFMGVLIEEFISSISEVGTVVKNNPVCVLYDTAVLLRVLGCSGRLQRVAAEELNRYLQDLGFTTYYFSGNEEEVSNIISALISVKDSGRELEGETAEALSTGEVTITDIRMLQNTFTDRLATYNIFPAGDLEKKAIDNAPYQIDERGFAEYIKKEAIARGVGYGLQNRQNDASYLGTIMRLRGGTQTRDLAACGYVFVTTNRFLAGAARKYLIEQKVLRGPHCPPMLSVGQIATIAWLMKEHVLAPENAGRELLSNCFAAIRPDQAWFRYFRESIEKNTGSVEEYAKEPKNALILQAARRIAQEESFGNSAIVRELNMAEILRKAEEVNARAWDEREAQFAAEREAIAAVNAKIVDELRAKQEGDMDPMTTAMVGALTALADDLAPPALRDAYAGVKSIIARKFGSASALAKSVDDLEANPKSKGRAIVLSEHLAELKVTSDAEITAAVGKLVETLAKDRAEGSSAVHIQSTMSGGVAGIVGVQNASIGVLNVGVPPVVEPGLFSLKIENIEFDENGPCEIYAEFFLSNPGKPTVIRKWILEASTTEGVHFSAQPRDVYTGGTNEFIAVGQLFHRKEDLSITPLEEGGARQGRVTYSHTGPSEPFRKPGTVFHLSAEDVLGRVVVARYCIGDP